MARIKYDVRGVEGKRTVVPAGVYNLKVVQADLTSPENKDERIELVAEVIGDKDHKGGKFYEYISVVPGSPQAWKLREFLEAIQIVGNGKGEAGTLDTAKLIGKVFGAKTFVRPADDSKGFDEQNRIRKMFAIDAKASSVTEDLDADDDDEPSDYEDMELSDLKAELAERGLSTKGKRAVLVSRLLEDDEQEDEEEPEGEYSWEDLEGMSRAELRTLNKDEELGVKVVKSKDDDTLRAEIAEALEIAVPDEEEDEEDEEEDEDEVEADDYEEWSVDDLKEELSQRSLSTKGSAKLLVKRLRADDAEEEKPF